MFGLCCGIGIWCHRVCKSDRPSPRPQPRYPSCAIYHTNATPTTTTAPATNTTPSHQPRRPSCAIYRTDAVANIATLTTTTNTTPPQQQQANTSTPLGTPAQEPPPPAPTYYASQPVQGHGVEVVDTQNMQARFTSDEPPPYNVAMHYPQVHHRQQNYPQPPAYLTQEQSNTTEEDPLPSAPCLTDQQQDPAPSAPCLTVQQQYPCTSIDISAPCLTDQQQYPPPNQNPVQGYQ